MCLYIYHGKQKNMEKTKKLFLKGLGLMGKILASGLMILTASTIISWMFDLNFMTKGTSLIWSTIWLMIVWSYNAIITIRDSLPWSPWFIKHFPQEQKSYAGAIFDVWLKIVILWLLVIELMIILVIIPWFFDKKHKIYKSLPKEGPTKMLWIIFLGGLIIALFVIVLESWRWTLLPFSVVLIIASLIGIVAAIRYCFQYLKTKFGPS